MKMFGGLSIRWKLTLLLGSVVSVVLLLTAITDAYVHVRTMRSQMVGEYSSLASVLGDNSAVALTVFPEAAQGIISDLTVSPAVVAAALYLPDNSIVARFPEDLPDADLPATPPESPSRFTKRYLLISHPVMQEESTVGHVFLRVSLDSLATGLRQKLFVDATIMSSALLLALLLSFVVQRFISQPILSLAAAARRIERDADFSIRVPKTSEDEIGELCDGFNSMLNHLERRDQELASEIAERKRFENHFRVAVEGAPVAMIMTDRHHAIVMTNAQAHNLFGFDEQDLTGSVTDFIPDFLRCSEHGGGGRAYEAIGIRHDKSEFPLEIAFSLISTEEGDFGLSAIVDISLRREAEAKLREMNATLEKRVAERTEALEEQSQELIRTVAELERSNQELDDFAYIASHDLKEPLRGISNFASFLVEDYADKLDEDGRHKLETLMRLCQRMESLIDSLLQFSRVGRAEIAIQSTNVNELVAEILDSLHIILDEQNVTVRVPAPLPTITCDRVRIGEVFRNLITNAYKYNTQEQKLIEIGIHAGGVANSSGEHDPGQDGVVFYVRDNGIGIREKHLDSIFRIFKRLHARDRYGGGTGAGLTFVKKIIERHGGRIWVESEYGQGTTFFFFIPQESETGAEPDLSTSHQTSPTKS